jgi:hypothetical protein
VSAPPSPRAVLIRAAIIEVLTRFGRISTASVSRLVTDRVEAGPTGLVLERMEVSHQLKGLSVLGKIQRHHDGQTEKARSRFGKDTHTRALRGSVSWSIGERSKVGGQPDRQPSRGPEADPSTRIDSCT